MMSRRPSPPKGNCGLAKFVHRRRTRADRTARSNLGSERGSNAKVRAIQEGLRVRIPTYWFIRKSKRQKARLSPRALILARWPLEFQGQNMRRRNFLRIHWSRPTDGLKRASNRDTAHTNLCDCGSAKRVFRADGAFAWMLRPPVRNDVFANSLPPPPMADGASAPSIGGAGGTRLTQRDARMGTPRRPGQPHLEIYHPR